MRTLPARPFARLLPLFLGLLLILTGCSAGDRVMTSAAAISEATPISTARTSPASAASTPTARTAAAPPSSKPSSTDPTTAATPSAAVITAVKAVIQRADDEQQQALAANDPTVMRDTATDDYYDELVSTNEDLANNGVTAIALLALDWGPIVQQSPTSVQVTAFETWSTTYADGTIDQGQGRERNVYTLVQDGGSWKIQSDDHPDTTTVVDQPNPGGTSGASPLPAAQTGAGQSSNWSGYAATGGTYTAVSGSWTVPQVTAASGSGADATWVGIGGVRTHDLIQAGTEATVTGGRVRYDAWVEMLPQSAQRVALVVNPGDSISVAITQQADTTWLIAFQNRTIGQDYQVTETYTSSRSSAEWVEEAPSTGQRLVPLDDFGTVQFQAASAVKDGQQLAIAQAGGTAITMIDRSGQILATPSALGGDGASFSVQRSAVAPASPAPTTPRRGR
jgi:hypothetical protein